MKDVLGMRSLFKRRLQLQLLFILLAAVLVASLSVLLISDAVESAEGVVLADAGRTLTAAVSELDQQYQDRVTTDSVWRMLPVPAVCSWTCPKGRRQPEGSSQLREY